MQENKFNAIELADETSSTVSRGAAISSAYTNQPIMYGADIIEAAKARFFFLDAVTVRKLPEGHKDYVEYKRTKFLGSAGITFDSGEKAGSDISNTAINNQTGVTITPTFYSARVTVENYAAQINVWNLVDLSREELVYGLADTVDQGIATGIGDATLATSAAAGATLLFGGDATTDATLAAGDILTPELVAEAEKYLKDKFVYYWNSGTFTRAASTVTKNPWMNESGEPFVLFISPSQEMALKKDSQFTNAAEYGSNEVVLNGEIGKYLGIKIVVTVNVEQVAASATGPDGNAAGTAMTRCILCKPKRAYSFVWGKEPTISVHPIPWQASQTVVLETAYAGDVIHDDAIVFIDVADL